MSRLTGLFRMLAAVSAAVVGLTAVIAAFGTLGWLFPHYDSGRAVLALVAGAVGTGGAVLAAGGAVALAGRRRGGRTALVAAGIGGSIAAIPGLVWLVGLVLFLARRTIPFPPDGWIITAVLLAPGMAAGIAFAAALLAAPRAAEAESGTRARPGRAAAAYAGLGWLAACLATFLATRPPHVRPEDTPLGWKALLWASWLDPAPDPWDHPPDPPAQRGEFASALAEILGWGTRRDALLGDQLASASRSAAAVVPHPGPSMGWARWRMIRAALEGLDRIGPPEAARAVPALLAHLRGFRRPRSPSYVFGMQAASALSGLAQRAPEAILPHVIEALKDPESRLGALHVLRFCRPGLVQYLPQIVPHLDAPDQESRVLAATAVLTAAPASAHAEPALDVLRAAIEGSDALGTQEALRAMQFLPGQARQIVPVIRARSSDPNPRIRLQAIQTLIAAEGLSLGVMDSLRKELESADPNPRAELLRHLRFVRTLPGVMSGLFKTLLADPTRRVRVQAAVNLAGDGDRDPALVPILIEGFFEPDLILRSQAADALGDLGGPRPPGAPGPGGSPEGSSAIRPKVRGRRDDSDSGRAGKRLRPGTALIRDGATGGVVRPRAAR